MTMKRSLAISALLGGIACVSFAQDSNKNPTFGTPKKIQGGFSFTEGPAPDAEGNVYFTDIPEERIHVYRTDGTMEEFMGDSGRCNGLMFDKNGQLWACQGGEGRVIRIDPKTKKPTTVAAGIDGGPFLSTNDLMLDAHGGAYFTDPAFSRHPDSKVDEGVYYVGSDGKITRLVEGISRPNGILLSPDGSTLYLLPSGEKRLIAYEVRSPGKIGPGRDLAKLAGGGDGLTCDSEGNLYLTQPRQKVIVVYSPTGDQIGSVRIPEAPANVCFGGSDFDRLYVTARTSLYEVPVDKKGLAPASVGTTDPNTHKGK